MATRHKHKWFYITRTLGLNDLYWCIDCGTIKWVDLVTNKTKLIYPVSLKIKEKKRGGVK